MKLKTKLKLYNLGYKGAVMGMEAYNRQKKRNFAKDLISVSLYAIPMVLVGMAAEYWALNDEEREITYS